MGTLRQDNPLAYTSWCAMRARCSDSDHASWPAYGGRGITVCAAWLVSFEAFLADMGERPSRAYSIERRNNDLGYDPSNCYWATAREQAANRSMPRWPNPSGFNVVGGSWLLGYSHPASHVYRLTVPAR